MAAVRFKFVDLMIVLPVVVIVFIAIIPRGLGRSHEAANRIKCAFNLRSIGMTMRMYANDETRTNAFPRTLYQPDAPPVAFTNPNAQNPFLDPNPPGPNDVTAGVFLLLRTQDFTTSIFICPSSPAAAFEFDPGKNIQNYSNFRSQRELSYSFHNPYGPADARDRGILWDSNLPADFAIAADISPGVAELLTTPINSTPTQRRKLNSPNHAYDGQNVLYADGHAEWQASPFVGASPNGGNGFADNIYTFGPNPAEAHPGITTPVGIIGPPAGPNDSILLSVWDASVAMPLYEEQAARSRWLIVGIATAAIFLTGVVVYAVLRRSRGNA